MTEQKMRNEETQLTHESAQYGRQDVVAAPEERVEPEASAARADQEMRGMSGGGDQEMQAALFSETDTGALSQQWESVQASFVDEPRQAVQRADQLVSDTISRLTETFARERGRLEQQWSSGDDVSTEDLRVALQRYRSFFQRLLSA